MFGEGPGITRFAGRRIATYGHIILFCQQNSPITKGNCMLQDVQVTKRKLGKTEIEITPIGLGMMEFSGGGGLMGFAFPVIDQEEKNATVKAGLDGGVNWFDTAELYGSGVSEKSLSTALKAAGVKDDEVVIATKWWPMFRTAGNI